MIVGIVLAGGRSSRMGGGDKTLQRLAGRPILAHVIERLRPQVTALAINANGDAGRFAGFGETVIPDTVDGFQGPLAGVLSGLDWSATIPGATHLVSVAGDTPFLPEDLVGHLAISAIAQPGRIAVSSMNGKAHPVFALWPLAVRDALADFLASQPSRRVADFLELQGAIEADFGVSKRHAVADSFFNINTPEDLAIAERSLRTGRSHTVIGIAGWKNSGKTTLIERLVGELTGRGYRVSTVKHAHHEAEVDTPGSDSFRHRAAGAAEVALVTEARWALINELRGDAEPSLASILDRLSPCDLVLLEGYKREPIAKIEVRRAAGRQGDQLSARDPNVVAVAAVSPQPGETVPVFGLDDVTAIADFIARLMALSPRG